MLFWFFLLSPEVSGFIFSLATALLAVVKYINSDNESFETGALPRLANENNLKAFMHYGFWQPMDTLREKNELAKMAKLSLPPWLEGI